MKKLMCFLILFLPVISSCSSSTGPGGGGSPSAQAEYVVFAWNDLGMHCLNPTYDKIVLLPPYNNLWVQVVKRGAKPEIVTTGVTVGYMLEDNSYSYGKRNFGQFWDNAVALFGSYFGFTSLPRNIGLKGNGLAGAMTVSGDHFVAEGVPVTPVHDSGAWDPYQVADITVRDSHGKVVAQTKMVVPTSDEIHCDNCHGNDPFTDIMAKHDAANGTDLTTTTPRLCAECHGSPALGLMDAGSSGVYLSKAIHGFHADKGAECYDCHPGTITQCSRSVRHTAADGNCKTCHSAMAAVANSIPTTRIPWLNEPKCATCHAADGVDTGILLYRNSKGHGQVYCAACHGSPHAMIPSLVAKDNYQSLQYQGSTGTVKSIASCGVCHNSSRGGGEIGDFAEVHGGSSPEHRNGCHICHTSVSTDTASWPHGFTWKDSN
jgi:hypothetical protein